MLQHPVPRIGRTILPLRPVAVLIPPHDAPRLRRVVADLQRRGISRQHDADMAELHRHHVAGNRRIYRIQLNVAASAGEVILPRRIGQGIGRRKGQRVRHSPLTGGKETMGHDVVEAHPVVVQPSGVNDCRIAQGAFVRRLRVIDRREGVAIVSPVGRRFLDSDCPAGIAGVQRNLPHKNPVAVDPVSGKVCERRYRIGADAGNKHPEFQRLAVLVVRRHDRRSGPLRSP